MNYARYQKIVKQQLAKYGKPVQFSLAAGPEEYDPLTGNVTQEVFEVAARAVMVSPRNSAWHSGAMSVGEAALLVDGLTLPQSPTEQDTVSVDGEEWKIVRVTKVAPADLVIIYKIYIRRS